MGLYILFIICLCFLYKVTFGYNISYIQRDTTGECWQRISHSGGIVFSHPGHHSYAENTDCKVTIVTKPGLRIAIRFDSFDITDSVNCYQDEILVYDGPALSSLRLTGTMQGLCGQHVPSAYKYLVSTGNEMTIRFITDDIISKNIGFTVVYSTIYPEDRPEDCFSCDAGDMCIHKDLKCDGLPNCKDGSDELTSLCNPPTQRTVILVVDDGWMTWMGTAFGVAVAFAIFFIVIIVVIVCICCGCSEPDGRSDVSDTQSYESAIEPMIIPAKVHHLQAGYRLSGVPIGVNQQLSEQFSNIFIPPLRPDMIYLPETTIGLLGTNTHFVAIPPDHV